MEEFSHYPQQDVLRVVRFILNYAEDHAIILRGRHPSCRAAGIEDLRTRKLPLSLNEDTVWRVYKDAVEKLGDGEPVVDQTNFKKVWRFFLPQIITKEPQTDLCLHCHSNKKQFRADLTKISIKSKSAKIREQLQHLDLVKKENLLYQEMNAECGMICKDSHLSLGTSRPASRKITMSYSCEFAQPVHYPSDPLQPGPLYFLIPRKCLLFGVCCGGMPKQVSYIIDEAMLPRGPDIHYLHHFFSNYGVGERCVNLYSSEENRNNCLLLYCAWRTMHKLHLKMDLHFRITGHDMSGTDLLFGLVKQVLRKTRVQTLSDIAAVVRDSTPKKQLNIPQLVGLEDGTVLVETYDWDKHLSSYFRCIPHIERYRHFSFDAKRPGVVMAKEHCDAEPMEFQMLLNADVRPAIDGLIVQAPPGLDMDRQKYFFEKIREFCSDETKDITCPPPKS